MQKDSKSTARLARARMSMETQRRDAREAKQKSSDGDSSLKISVHVVFFFRLETSRSNSSSILELSRCLAFLRTIRLNFVGHT